MTLGVTIRGDEKRTRVTYRCCPEHAWRSRPIAAPRLDFEFFANEPVTPELCFEIDPIDYQWNRGELLEVAR